MTNGYESWWHVGIAEVSKSQRVQAAYESKVSNLQQARSY